eukprot:12019009-Prorocentrum_lima.AAC.1
MTSSLVGSEMCIRDSHFGSSLLGRGSWQVEAGAIGAGLVWAKWRTSLAMGSTVLCCSLREYNS